MLIELHGTHIRHDDGRWYPVDADQTMFMIPPGSVINITRIKPHERPHGVGSATAATITIDTYAPTTMRRTWLVTAASIPSHDGGPPAFLYDGRPY